MAKSIIEEIRDIYERNLIPLSVDFELTRRCNLNCKHCYIPPRERKSKGGDEISTSKIKDIISELAQMGTFFITFTGGEIFTRGDIWEILFFAKQKNFIINIFTNATLLTEGDIDLFQRLSPYLVHISLYSHLSQIHDSITRKKGSFEKTLNSIKKLKEKGVNIIIKSPLMKDNFQHYHSLINLAKSLKLKWKLDPIITPRDDKNSYPLKWRLGKEELKKIFNDEMLFPYKKFVPKGNLICSAGKSVAGISAKGDVYPCLVWTFSVGNIKNDCFKNIWRNSIALNGIRKIRKRDLKKCNSCNLLSYCGRCSGLAYLETGDMFGPSIMTCLIAEVIKEKLENQKII